MASVAAEPDTVTTFTRFLSNIAPSSATRQLTPNVFARAGVKPDYALFDKNLRASHKFSDTNVQKLTINVMLLLLDLRYGFLNLEALNNFASSLTITKSVSIVVNFRFGNTAYRLTAQRMSCCTK